MRMLRLALLWLVFCSPAFAQVGQIPGGIAGSQLKQFSGGFTPSCTASSNFLARATTITVTADKTRYDTLICTLETASVGCTAKLDALYVLAAPNSTAALLNLCSGSFPLTVNGSISFSANNGYTGTGANTDFLGTAFTPPGTRFTQNSASIGCYILSDHNTFETCIGGLFPEDVINLGHANNGMTVNGIAINDTSITTQIGAWVATVTNSTSGAFYRSGSATISTLVSTTSGTTSGVSSGPFSLCGELNGSTTLHPCSFQIGAAFIGGALTSTQAQTINNAINAFMAALTVPINVY